MRVLPILVAVAALTQAAPKQPELAAEIQAMFRSAFQDDKYPPRERLNAILKEHGVPHANLVGIEAAEDFVTLIAMQLKAPGLRKAQALYEEASTKGDVPISMAVLLRVRAERAEAEAQPQKPPTHPQLRDEIQRLYVDDQAVRAEGRDGDVMAAMDQKHATPLRAILDRYGVPTFDMVGREAAGNFVIMLQHMLPEFRKKALPLLKRNVEDGQADASHFAMEYDRAQTDQGKPQLYGEGFRCGPAKSLDPDPVVDPAHVDERRAAMGLEPFGAKTRQIRLVYPHACEGVQ